MQRNFLLCDLHLSYDSRRHPIGFDGIVSDLRCLSCPLLDPQPPKRAKRASPRRRDASTRRRASPFGPKPTTTTPTTLARPVIRPSSRPNAPVSRSTSYVRPPSPSRLFYNVFTSGIEFHLVSIPWSSLAGRFFSVLNQQIRRVRRKSWATRKARRCGWARR